MQLHRSNPIRALKNMTITFLIGDRERRLLLERHFSERSCAGAGGFRDWRSIHSAFRALYDALEPHVIKTAQEVAMGSAEDDDPDSVELTCGRPIGWSCTRSLNAFSGERFDNVRLSSRRTGWMVPDHRTDLLAPLTNQVTAIYRVCRDRHGPGWCCFLLNLRPGEDLDADDGDMTEQTGLVFYPFGHPGEPLPQPSTR